MSDSEARLQALDTSRSFAVSAPAGSGKTELLIQRTLKLLSQVDQPENILAITFTRKAASEMRARIITALEEAKSNTPLQSQHQQTTRELAQAALAQNASQNWQLLENPGRLRIQTIDAFCRQIANQLCLDTGVSLPPKVSEDTDNLYRAAAERTLNHLDDDSAVGESLRKLVAHVDGHLEELATLFANLLGSRDSWLPLALSSELINSNYLEERISAMVDETLLQTETILARYQSDLELLLDYALFNAEKNPDSATWLDDQLAPFIPAADSSELAAWKGLVRFLTSGSGQAIKFRASPDKRLGFPADKDSEDKQAAVARKQQYKDLVAIMAEKPELLSLLDRIRALPSPEREAKTGDLNRALLQLLPTLAAEFNLLSQEIGETDYAAISITALQALGEPDMPTPLALRLDYRISHILVDEFQDTANTQVHLLERLTAGWQPDDERTLFIVGDGMQSIYSFRKANVALFIRARRQGIGDLSLDPLDLTANFRSEAQIVNWVNQTFQALFPKEDNLVQGQVAFREAQAVQTESEWPIRTLGCASEEQEAQLMAADIASKLDTSDDSMAILVRGRTHLRAILPALRAQHIQWQAQDIDPLFGRMAVMDIHSLTRALCVPADRIAWLSILRAPWAGLDNADLYHLCQWQSNEVDEPTEEPFPPLWTAILAANTIDTLSDDGKQILERIKRLCAESFEQLGRFPLRNIVETLWRKLDAEAGLLDAQEKQDVADYLDLLERIEQAGNIPDWPKFERSLERLFAKPAERNDSEKDAPSAARLQIMTIHKSKGLEFDHVYIPALDKRQRASDNALLLWWEREYEDGSEGYLLSTKPAKGEADDLYSYLKTEQNTRERQERARLLYVACTRAKKSLLLSARLHYDDNKDQIKKPDSGSMLGLIWNEFEEDFCREFSATIESGSNEPRSLTYIRRLDPKRPFPESSITLQGAPQENVLTEEVTPIDTPRDYSANYLQRITGNILHETLMNIVRDAEANPSTHIFLPTWERQLDCAGLDSEQRDSVIQSLENSLARMLEDTVGKWLLAADHEDSQAELEFDYLDSDDTLQRAVIDRTFLCDGTRWIIDYKSSFPGENESEDAFLTREAAQYQPQMRRYASLFKNKGQTEGSHPVKTLLYFPVISRSIEVEA